MDASRLSQLHLAVEVIHNPASDNATRSAAQQHIEALKAQLSPYDLARLGLSLNAQSNSMQIRFFGLSLVEYVLRLGWDRIDGIQAGLLRADILSLLSVFFSAGNQELFLKEKTCVLVAQTAERMWPLQWPELDGFLRASFLLNLDAQECVLLIYKTIIEDTFCYENSIAEMRKKDLSTSLIAITVDSSVLNSVYTKDRESTQVESVLNIIRADPHAEGWLRRLAQNLVALKRNKDSGINSGRYEKLILLTLDIISTVFQWIILEGIESTGVLQLVFELLVSTSPDEQIAAVECISSLLSRNSLVVEEKYWQAIIAPLFENPNLLGSVFTAILGVYQCPDWSQIYQFVNSKVISDDGYEYLKRLADAVSVFGERQLFNKHMVQKPSRFESYLELLFFFVTHPSRMISSIASPVWSDLGSHVVFQKAPEVRPYVSRVLQFCVLRIFEGESVFISATASAYDTVDYEDETERRGCIDANRVRYLEIMKHCALLEPYEFFATVDTHIRQLVFSEHRSTAHDVFGFLQRETEVGNKFEHASLLIEQTMKFIPNVLDPNLSDSRLLLGVSSLFKDVIALEVQDPIIIRCTLSIVACIAESVRDPESLLKCVQKIVGVVTFTYPDETEFKQRNVILRDETRQIRMKAASALVKLAVSLPDTLIPLLDNFVQMIQSFIQRDQILQFERVKLIEFLLALIHYSSKDMTEKSCLFGSIIENYVAEWETKDMFQFDSSESLLTILGIAKYSTGELLPENVVSIEIWRRKVNLDVRTWMMWMKRTKDQPNLWPDYLFRILPKILKMTRCLHLLGNPVVWQHIPSHCRVNLRVSESEREAILKKTNTKSEVSSDSSKSFVDATASWISSIRETCYGLIGTMTGFGHKFYLIPGLGDIILSSLFCEAEHLDNRHWKSLISGAVRPLLMNCPSLAQDELLGTIIPPLFQFIKSRLDKEWAALEAAKQGMTAIAADDDDEVSEEIIAEKILRELTRTVADLLVAIASPDEGRPGIKAQDLVAVEGTVYAHVMASQTVFEAVFASLLHIMQLKDTIGSRKALVAILKTLPILIKTQRRDVFAFLGDNVTKSCLKIFHDGYFQEVHNEAISLVGDIYLGLRNANDSTAYQTLLALPGMSSASLQAFDNQFMAPEKNKKERNVILRHFLKRIKGTSVSEAFKEFDGKTAAKVQLGRNFKRRDILDDDNRDNAAILDVLF